MVRPKENVDNVELHLRIPRELKQRLVTFLLAEYSPGLVPQGAMSSFICAAIERGLASPSELRADWGVRK